jgi:hypothetical protein
MAAALVPGRASAHLSTSALAWCLQSLAPAWAQHHGEHLCGGLRAAHRSEPREHGCKSAHAPAARRARRLGRRGVAALALPEPSAAGLYRLPGLETAGSGGGLAGFEPAPAWAEADAQACRGALAAALRRRNLREALRLAHVVWGAGLALGPQQGDALLQGASLLAVAGDAASLTGRAVPACAHGKTVGSLLSAAGCGGSVSACSALLAALPPSLTRPWSTAGHVHTEPYTLLHAPMGLAWSPATRGKTGVPQHALATSFPGPPVGSGVRSGRKRVRGRRAQRCARPGGTARPGARSRRSAPAATRCATPRTRRSSARRSRRARPRRAPRAAPSCARLHPASSGHVRALLVRASRTRTRDHLRCMLAGAL